MEDDHDLYAAYFGRSADYYLYVLERFRAGQPFVFNVYALLFGLFWFLFRKMYRETLMFFAISLMLGFLQTYLFHFPSLAAYAKPIGMMLTLLLNLSYGIFGNYFYMRKAISEVEYAKTQSANKEEGLSYLSNKGQTTLHPVFLLIIVYLVYIILLQRFA